MFCGKFSHVDDDPLFSRSSAQRVRRKQTNPYSNQGLDKYAKVLADLKARREKIMAQIGAKDVFLVRFTQSKASDSVPIVVQLKDSKQAKTGMSNVNRPIHQNSVAVDESPVGFSAAKQAVPEAAMSDERTKKSRFSWGVNINPAFMNIQKPSNYWSVLIILVLFCTVIFGRSFAIFCTCIWWYSVPKVKGGKVNVRKPMQKKFGRRDFEKNLGGNVRLLQSKIGHGRSAS